MLKIETLKQKIPVYDITVKDNNNFFANDILVHNCTEIFLTAKNLTELSNFSYKEAVKYGMYHEGMSIKAFQDKFGEIALCTLSNINWGAIKTPEDFETPCRLAVYALDALLDYQDYPMIAAEVPSKARRQIGIGVNNLAHFLAKRKLAYGSAEALKVIDEYMQAMYYYLVKASLELAKTKGACEWWDDLNFDFIFNKRASAVDSLIPHVEYYDWDSLMEEIKVHGLRHSVLVSTPPSESNSLIINATNGIEPPRAKMTPKGNGDDSYKQIVPNVSLKYDYTFSTEPKDYLKTVAVLQKYHDQGISVNTSYDPSKYENDKIPAKVLIEDLLFAQKMGIKSLYYHQTPGEDDENGCESCKL